MAEWSKARAWKVRRRVTVSRVRIPSCPPYQTRNLIFINGLTVVLLVLPPRSPPQELHHHIFCGTRTSARVVILEGDTRLLFGHLIWVQHILDVVHLIRHLAFVFVQLKLSCAALECELTYSPVGE